MSDPVDVFLACWLAVRKALPSQRTSAPSCAPELDIRIKRALSTSRGEEAAQTLQSLLAEAAASGTPESELPLLGLRLHIMQCIDREFARIHPRAFQDEDDAALADWLQSAQARRRSQGVLGTCCDVNDATGEKTGYDLALIFRGPLLRAQRDETASYAENLADRFAYLGVTKTRLTLKHSPIDVRFSVIDQHSSRGVDEGSRPPGGERVCVVPVAEKREHVTLTTAVRDDKRYVTYSPSSGFDPAATLLDALRRCGDLDIALAPEFVMSPEAHVSAFSDMGAAPLACRLLLAGTANTHSRDVAGQPWNEAVVANQCGVPLWHQQKLWPSEITPERAAEFGITGVGGAGNFHEDVASGSQIEVVDIDSLGRCVILICQDITSSDLATTLITDVQPDWVFVPIMDRGFAEKSWFSDIGQTVCTYSQARLVGICSTALPRAGTDKPHCLQIFCAERGEKYAPWRAVSLLAADGEPGAAIHHFGVTKWMRFDTVLKEAD